jgi:hypothetical protein
MTGVEHPHARGRIEMRATLRKRLACAHMALGAALMVFGCDQDYPDYGWDVAMDAMPEVGADTAYEPPPDVPRDPGTDPGSDSGADPGTDPGVESGVDTSGCTYPDGPYAYTGLGDTVAPVSWSTAIRAPSETYPSPTASFEDFYCDPEVESIVYILATRS